MDAIQRRLSAAAWSMIESLSALRKSVHQELDFIRSVSASLPTDKLEDALSEIDFFTTEISGFLSDIREMEEEKMEEEYRALSYRFDSLEQLVEGLLGR